MLATELARAPSSAPTYRRWGRAMRDYTFHIYDDRYTVPTLAFVVVRDEARAHEMAEEHLRASRHYLAIEVFEGEALRFRLER
jgi:hypothetical protein